MVAKPKFESRLQVWVTTATADAYEALAADGMLAVSDHLRLALSNHLHALGLNAPAPSRPTQRNDQPHQEQAHGL